MAMGEDQSHSIEEESHCPDIDAWLHRKCRDHCELESPCAVVEVDPDCTLA